MDTIKEAHQLMEDNKSEEALQLLQDHLKKANVEEQFAIAELYVQWGFLDEGIQVLYTLLAQYPNEAELKVVLADMLIELEKDDQAIDLLNEIDEENPFYTQALLQLADLYQSLGLYEVAERKLHEAKERDPNESIIDFALGELFFSIGKYMHAITFYEKVLPVSPIVGNVSIYSRLGEAQAAMGEYEAALASFEKTTIEDDPDTLFKYGYIAYQAKQYTGAINAWKKVIELDPYYQAVYVELAKAFKEEGLIKEAYQTCYTGIQKDEFNKQLYYLAGTLARQLNKVDESKEYATQAIALDPEYKEAILLLIELLKEQNEWEEINHVIDMATSNGAIDPIFDWEKARVYNELEDYPNALVAYNEAYSHFIEDADFLKEFGYFLVEDGKIDRAISILKAYLELEPLDSDVEAYLERFK
ncbi:tetratricopeptide repeat protein [Virgibacillus sp. W0430]|uniref:tetratricopeptide repeat protein n=1 Tax=Virgibacillus sp. W0430 TaxID=3391580 RepID=UPI003F48FF4E